MNSARTILLAGLILMLAAAVAAQPAPTLIIRSGTLIDGTGKPPVERTTVFVTGDRITRIVTGEVDIPTGARVIDATGLTVLPGLMDMHIHHRSWMWPLFLQFGVTTVRDVGSDPDVILRERDRERRGELSAPRIFACGPLLDGVPPVWGTGWRGSMGLTSVDQARAAAQRLIDRGVDCLKVYIQLPAPLMRAIVEIASARGVQVTGHVGVVSAREAAGIGVQSIEHASGIRYPMPPEAQESLIRLFVSRSIFIVATLLVEENIANLPDVGNPQYPNLALVPAHEVMSWLDWRNDVRFREAGEVMAFDRFRQYVAAKAAFVQAFYRAGGKIVAGSDTPNPFVIPGVSLHQELESLVAVGLSPMNAIKSATSVAAALLRRADLGVIEEGRLADMVLVSGNPANDITATRNIRVVIKGGVIVPKAWYNIAADLPVPPPPVIHLGTKQPIGPADLAPLFPMALIMQEVSTDREIEIPQPVRDIYRLWRPTPLHRARRLEKALDTPARIYYKYEGTSPAGSHKPNTAVAQAFYNKQEGCGG